MAKDGRQNLRLPNIQIIIVSISNLICTKIKSYNTRLNRFILKLLQSVFSFIYNDATRENNPLQLLYVKRV